MKIRTLLDHCKTRIPWPTMRSILKRHRLPVGQGWDATINKLILLKKSGDKESKKINILEESYFEHLLTGERAIKLFHITDDELATLIDFFDNYTIEDNVFNDSYPYPLTEDQLKAVDKKTVLVAIEDNMNCKNLVFCTKRYITERKELNIDELSKEVRDGLNGYDELIAIKHNMRQCFDVVTIWKDEKFIEVRVDLAGGMSSDDQHFAFKDAVREFNSLTADLFEADHMLGSPINLFPLVDSMYESTNEGRVCELAFITDTASIKHEKMRRKEVCLRDEAYHRAGKKAVHHITPFRLGICWTVDFSFDVETKPELLFPGNFRILSMESQFLGEAIISNCCGYKDYEFVVNKIRHYLNENNN